MIGPIPKTNLGRALTVLGERESGTARLEEAVSAHRAALVELTRERGPLHWAATQNNLGLVLRMLGERERGTARLEEAITAFREALQVDAREGLGNALEKLGERGAGQRGSRRRFPPIAKPCRN